MLDFYQVLLYNDVMKYPFLTLDDGTEIVHSETLSDGKVEVYVEKPDEKDCFHNASCFIPGYEWKNINGFSEQEISKYQEIIESTAHLILDFARNGGFEDSLFFRIDS